MWSCLSSLLIHITYKAINTKLRLPIEFGRHWLVAATSFQRQYSYVCLTVSFYLDHARLDQERVDKELNVLSFQDLTNYVYILGSSQRVLFPTVLSSAGRIIHRCQGHYSWSDVI